MTSEMPLDLDSWGLMRLPGRLCWAVASICWSCPLSSSRDEVRDQGNSAHRFGHPGTYSGLCKYCPLVGVGDNSPPKPQAAQFTDGRDLSNLSLVTQLWKLKPGRKSDCPKVIHWITDLGVKRKPHVPTGRLRVASLVLITQQSSGKATFPEIKTLEKA